MLLVFQPAFSLAMACFHAILEITSGFDPSSDSVAPRYLTFSAFVLYLQVNSFDIGNMS